ncbi:Protein M05B5.2 [Aphelenchoides avenae]|nr:Protein M05B5.2 [Aphelenchus avenae]
MTRMPPRFIAEKSAPLRERASMDAYVEGTLAGRRIWWCPGGQGYIAYCPQPIDPDAYSWCCTYYYLDGTDMPTCCLFPIPTGVVIALFFCVLITLSLLTLFTCWCCPACPLARRMLKEAALRNLATDELEQDERARFYDTVTTMRL